MRVPSVVGRGSQRLHMGRALFPTGRTTTFPFPSLHRVGSRRLPMPLLPLHPSGPRTTPQAPLEPRPASALPLPLLRPLLRATLRRRVALRRATLLAHVPPQARQRRLIRRFLEPPPFSTINIYQIIIYSHFFFFGETLFTPTCCH